MSEEISPILVVDDERAMRESLAAWLREDGYRVDMAADGPQALERVREMDYAVCFVDLKMPGGMDGIETMREIRRLRPDTAVVIVTAFAAVDTAVTAMKEGAHDYLVKPFNVEEVSLLTKRLVEMREIRRDNRWLRRKLSERYQLGDILSKSPRMQAIFDLVRRVADLKSTVLILGESGTGKELIAGAIHDLGGRKEKPFVHVACTALAETLLESELFGHEKGSFTGAHTRKIGKFEQADGGTILLDEIGDITPKLQLELLRVLEEKSFFRVGGAEEIRVDVRIIAATNRDLEQAVREGAFREDLYYRLNVVSIRLPPLRERREDIPLLVRHFLRRFAAEFDTPPKEVSDAALKVLVAWDWPGNVRELENAVERAIVTCPVEVLGPECFDFLPRIIPEAEWDVPTDLSIEELEKRVIPAVLRRTGGNVKRAAEILGIDRSTLYDKMRRYELRR
ncbi:MAG: sigma-54 dependent transcriptional regulator [Planctomycetes bacterium]|jgi:DNA-binding NtrC family response regulator|nr:sigma-54 dependent transcriptional regulator [Planctomycetota bacterium]